MTGGDFWDVVDPARSARLDDVGLPGFTAAVVLGVDGAARLVLVSDDEAGDAATRYDADCQAAPHERCGKLPLTYLRRLTVAARRARGESQDNANGRNSDDT
jgi:hypothetical protein